MTQSTTQEKPSRTRKPKTRSVQPSQRKQDTCSTQADCHCSPPEVQSESDVPKNGKSKSTGFKSRILRERVNKFGYVLRRELVENPCIGEKPIDWTMVYTPNGEYIGAPKDADYLTRVKGIFPQISSPENSVCSIGFSAKDGKWYGWSHRAIFGFKIGSKCRKGDCHYIPRRHGGKGEWLAKTVADAKQMAIDFASSVS